MLTLIKTEFVVHHLQRITLNAGKSLDLIYEESPEHAVLEIEKIEHYLNSKKQEYFKKALEENPELFHFI